MSRINFALPSTSYIRREKIGNILTDFVHKRRFLLNNTAADILFLVDAGCQKDEIVRTLATFYNVNKEKIEKHVHEFIEKCLSEGVLIEKLHSPRFASRKWIKLLAKQHRIRDSGWLLKSPFEITLYPTFRCNQDCLFCFVPSYYRCRKYSKDFDMNFKQAKYIIKQMIDADVRELQIVGGEPFLLSWMNSFLSYTTKMRVFTTVTTNGSIISDKIVNKIPASEYLSINVSIHGLRETHDYLTKTEGAFIKAEKTVKALSKRGVNVSVTCVVVEYNLKEIRDIILHFTKLGVNNFGLLYPYAYGGASKFKEYPPPEVFWELTEKLKSEIKNVDIQSIGAFGFIKYGNRPPCKEKDPIRWLGALFCKAGTTKIDVLPNGDVVPCFPLYMKIGNVFNEKLTKIWKSPLLEIFRNGKIPQECQECKFAYTCRGGCPIYRIERYGSLDRADGRCPYIR